MTDRKTKFTVEDFYLSFQFLLVPPVSQRISSGLFILHVLYIQEKKEKKKEKKKKQQLQLR